LGLIHSEGQQLLQCGHLCNKASVSTNGHQKSTTSPNPLHECIAFGFVRLACFLTKKPVNELIRSRGGIQHDNICGLIPEPPIGELVHFSDLSGFDSATAESDSLFRCGHGRFWQVEPRDMRAECENNISERIPRAKRPHSKRLGEFLSPIRTSDDDRDFTDACWADISD
jgi:hypothetical protein